MQVRDSKATSILLVKTNTSFPFYFHLRNGLTETMSI